MEDPIAVLRARVDALEKRADLALEVADRAESSLGELYEVVDVVLMPIIFHLAGDAHRQHLAEGLAEMQRRLEAHMPDIADPRLVQRLRYWRSVLAARQPWHGFEVDGWQSHDQPDRPARG